ncbi:MAG: HAMP domain-containing sensor histidine kinase [Elusimicrobiota bacterium]
MKLRIQLALGVGALVVALLAGTVLSVLRVQRRALERQSDERLTALLEGAARVTGEAVAARDELMAVSYLMFLKREHPELVYAEALWGSHSARIGEPSPGLRMTGKAIEVRGIEQGAGRESASSRPVPGGAAGPLGAGRESASSRPVPGGAAGPLGAELRLGFDAAALDAAISRALRPLLLRTLGLGAFFGFLGILAALLFAWRLSRPLSALAAAADEVGRGRLDASAAVRGPEEVRLLAVRFNAMTGSLRDLMQFREDMLHTLTHELNNPLGGLKAYIGLLEEGRFPSGERGEEAVRTMGSAVRRMEASLANALALFRAGRPRAEAPGGLARIDDIVAETVRLFTPAAEAKGVRLLVGKLAQASLRGDEEPLRRVAANLVSNAVKYTPEGGEIRVSVEVDARRVFFRVADTGRGIAPEHLPKIFEKFDRAGESRIPGAGLGLHIVRSAVEALGGTVAVESVLGKGSTFTVVLPKA